MQNMKLFLIAALMSYPPYGWILKFAGEEWQLFGVIIQLIGLSILIIKRKEIF